MRPANPRVQEHTVERIHGIFRHLQPVARIVDDVGHEIDTRQSEGVVDWKFRLLIGGAKIGKDDSAIFEDRIGTLAAMLRYPAVRRLSRSFQDRAVHIEKPSVIAATNSMLRHDTVFERRAADGSS